MTGHRSRRRYPRLGAITGLIAGLVLVAGCGSSGDSSSGSGAASAGTSTPSGSSSTSGGGSSSSEKGPITIGFATSSSGYLNVFDKPAVVAAEIMRDQINAEGGINGRQLRFVHANAKSDPSASAAAALQVISKGANFVVATCDYDAGAPAARVAQAKKIISIASCASAPEWNKIGPYAYSMSMGSITEAAVNAGFAYKKGCRNAYQLTDTSIAYTQQISNNIPKYFKGKIVGKDTFKNGDSSFSSQVSRLQSASPKPDCIFLTSYVPGGVTMLRSLRAAGITQMTISPDGMDGDFWISAIPNLSNFYFSAYASLFGDDPNPKVNELFSNIAQRQKVKRVSGSAAVTGASIIEALKMAIEKAGSADSDKVRAQLDQLTDADLLVGPTTFTPATHLSIGRPMAVIGVTDGKYGFVELFKPEGVTL